MAESPDEQRSPATLNLLIVEDSADDAALVVAELQGGGYDVRWDRVDSQAALEERLTARTWDLVISDHTLPEFSAPDALRVVREQAGDLPFIIVSGSIGEDQAVAVMKAGANDYLLKGRLARLTPAVERELGEAAQRRKHTEAEELLRHTEDQLRQAQKMEAIGRMAGGIAHDFNNLLTAILGYSELVLGSIPNDAVVRDDVEEIRNAGKRAAALTQQLLAFSRQQILEPRVVQLNGIITTVEKLLRRVIGEDIELRVELDAKLPPVRVDRGQIEQVLMNLAINARDAMPCGGHLTVRSRARFVARPLEVHDVVLSPGEYAFVSVVDSGTGMPPATIARAFEPFFTTKDPGKGTGLGLSTVYGIVRQSGGAIGVNSVMGKGTELGIYLPCANAPVDVDRDDAETTASVNGSESVVIVDDEAGIRALVRRALEPLGYQVLSAANGVEALNLVAGHKGRLDLLITDVVMPKMGGRELVHRLSAIRGDLPVLFLSGYPDVYVDTPIPHGPYASIVKPFTPSALTRKVRDLLNQASQRPPETGSVIGGA